ncbi:MAG TPA: transglutaminase N-terminal domain-containing protein, partial [Ktedonobacteraceae bacterium]|nr:transglutaminase N-terminal domain-containing protein [Ktedonobacteraceae bacterium]
MNQEPVDIETQIAALNLLDHQEIDWKRVQRTAYLIHQHFRYDYPGPVRDLKQRLLIVPPNTYGDQQCIVHRLVVSSQVAETSSHVDEFANHVINLYIPYIEQTIDFEAWIVVERFADHGPHILPGVSLSDPRYLEPSTLTQPNDALREVAAILAAAD